jgi:hypothetical protein
VSKPRSNRTNWDSWGYPLSRTYVTEPDFPTEFDLFVCRAVPFRHGHARNVERLEAQALLPLTTL